MRTLTVPAAVLCLALYACGTPTGPVVATIELTPTSLSLVTRPEAPSGTLVYATPGGHEVSLTLYLPQYGYARLFPTALDAAGDGVLGTLAWSSRDASVVTVSRGEVYATGVGSATVTASAEGVTSNPVAVTVSGEGPFFPAIVCLHGGGWSNPNPNELPANASDMAGRGFVGAIIDYRLAPEFRFPAAVEDSKAAVRWLRANATKYHIDPERIGALGSSAGGVLAGLLGTTAGIAEFEGDGGNPGFSSRVQAVAVMNGTTDLVARYEWNRGHSAVRFMEDFLGATYEEDPNLWVKASPITHVGPESAPFFLWHGTGDINTPYQQSVDMASALEAAGVYVEFITAADACHSCWQIPPWNLPTMDAMERFFNRP